MHGVLFDFRTLDITVKCIKVCLEEALEGRKAEGLSYLFDVLGIRRDIFLNDFVAADNDLDLEVTSANYVGVSLDKYACLEWRGCIHKNGSS
jgi:hypothetical protein